MVVKIFCSTWSSNTLAYLLFQLLISNALISWFLVNYTIARIPQVVSSTILIMLLHSSLTSVLCSICFFSRILAVSFSFSFRGRSSLFVITGCCRLILLKRFFEVIGVGLEKVVLTVITFSSQNHQEVYPAANFIYPCLKMSSATLKLTSSYFCISFV